MRKVRSGNNLGPWSMSSVLHSVIESDITMTTLSNYLSDVADHIHTHECDPAGLLNQALGLG